jgi:membrane protein DedA with SNARE-associated domain
LSNSSSSRRWSRPSWLLLVGVGIGIAVIVAVVLLGSKGYLREIRHQSASVIRGFLKQHGEAGAIGLLYIEESGVPMPVPGDAFVFYVGHRLSSDLVAWLAAWLGFIAAVVLGATNLYLIARRWGWRLARGRPGRVFHVTPARLARAERWFKRWGFWALLIGRHIPGMRVPLTVAAGTFEFPYRLFALSVGISAATWAAIFLFLGNQVGDDLQAMAEVHQGLGTALVLIVLAVFVTYLVLRLRQAPEAD